MLTTDELQTEFDHVLNCLTDAERRISAARIRIRQLHAYGPFPPNGLRVPLARLGEALTAIACARRDLRPACLTWIENDVDAADNLAEEEEEQR